jgi:uncharacterized membrane protein
MQTASTTTRNVKAISRLEHSALAQRSLSARVGDAIASHAGKMWFVIFHLFWFSLWLWVNTESKFGLAFDPFPYPLLSTVVSLESIFLSLFILMSQNRSSVQADQRNHLDLQINLLSEEENTKMLQMLQAICEHHNLAVGKDPETTAMAKRTEIGEVLSELQEHLPASE